MMEYVTLSNGVKMPVLGYGTFTISNEETERCVTDAIHVGYRSIDTAQASVSYTHLDVYKRQMRDSASEVSFCILLISSRSEEGRRARQSSFPG